MTARARKLRAIKSVWRRNHCLPFKAARWLIRYGALDGKRPKRKPLVQSREIERIARMVPDIGAENG